MRKRSENMRRSNALRDVTIANMKRWTAQGRLRRMTIVKSEIDASS